MTTENNPPIYSSLSGGPGTAVPAPAPLNSGQQDDFEERIKAVVESRLSEVESKYQDRIKALEEQLKSAKQPAVGVLSAHSGGPAHNLAPTWSQRLQELSRDGQLTEEILTAAGYAAEDVAGLL